MSLRRLGVETLDLFQLHRVDPHVAADEQFGLLADLQREGKVREVGLSQVSVAEIEAAGRIVDVASVQNRYNLVDRSSDDVLRHCTAHGIGFIPWAPGRRRQARRAGQRRGPRRRRARRDAGAGRAGVAAAAQLGDAARSRAPARWSTSRRTAGPRPSSSTATPSRRWTPPAPDVGRRGRARHVPVRSTGRARSASRRARRSRRRASTPVGGSGSSPRSTRSAAATMRRSMPAEDQHVERRDDVPVGVAGQPVREEDRALPVDRAVLGGGDAQLEPREARRLHLRAQAQQPLARGQRRSRRGRGARRPRRRTPRRATSPGRRRP